MKRQIAIDNKKIIYTIRKSRRARRLRVAVYCDGTIVVTTPFDLKETIIEKFIKEKSKWLLDKVLFFKQSKWQVITKSNRKDYLKYKSKAYDLAVEQVNNFNKIYKFRFNQINIKNQKTRWGSCSKKGNLNFNYKIALLPKVLSDYIIVHELCHLGEFNHSKRFWNLLKRSVPNYLEIKRKFKRG
ncbi:MAG: hypothetical protein CEN87_680 [Parcubacteria group bacterium Licking1014_1]|nr:MAG: hypothetical protein CEN87_680 [Parcubacteria group bacterium Licking1014_1]